MFKALTALNSDDDNVSTMSGSEAYCAIGALIAAKFIGCIGVLLAFVNRSLGLTLLIVDGAIIFSIVAFCASRMLKKKKNDDVNVMLAKLDKLGYKLEHHDIEHNNKNS